MRFSTRQAGPAGTRRPASRATPLLLRYDLGLSIPLSVLLLGLVAGSMTALFVTSRHMQFSRQTLQLDVETVAHLGSAFIEYNSRRGFAEQIPFTIESLGLAQHVRQVIYVDTHDWRVIAAVPRSLVGRRLEELPIAGHARLVLDETGPSASRFLPGSDSLVVMNRVHLPDAAGGGGDRRRGALLVIANLGPPLALVRDIARTQGLLVLALVCAAALALAAVLHVVLTRRARRITDWVRRLGEDPALAREVPIQGGDELAALAASLAASMQALQQKEEERARADARYRQLVETMPQGVIYTDADGRLLYANHAAERLGCARTEDIEACRLLAVPGGAAPAAAGAGGDDAPPGGDWDKEAYTTVCRTPAGAAVELLVHCARDVDAAGRVRGHLAVFWDETERLAAERTIRRLAELTLAEARAVEAMLAARDDQQVLEVVAVQLRQVFGDALVEVAELDDGGSRLTVRFARGGPASGRRRGAVGLDGTPEALALTEVVTVVVADAGSDARFDAAGGALPGAMRSGLCVPVRTHTGVHGTLSVYFPQPREFAAEEIHSVERTAHALGQALARHRLMADLRRSEALLVNFFESPVTGMAIVSDELRYRRVNQALARFLGYGADELVGMATNDLTHPDDRERSKALVERLRRSGAAPETQSPGARQIVKRYLHKDGAVVWGLVGTSMFHNDDGERMWAVQVTDWTARVQVEQQRDWLEKKLRAQAEALEKVVESRTAELAEKNAELEAFTHTVAHDLRAPARGMKGLSSALIEDFEAVLPGEVLTYLGRIHAAASRMDELVRDLLDYSQLGREDFRPRTVPLSTVVAAALDALAGRVKDSGARVAVEDVDLPVRVEPAVLTSMVTNLVDNALTYVPQGTQPRVTVRAESRGAMVRLWVEDNGIGVPDDQRERIFEVFERLHSSESYSGTGIGLALVARGTRRLGGACGVTAAAGGGSRFWIDLPAGVGSAQRIEGGEEAG